MVIEYKVSRKDMAQAYFYNLQHSARMQRLIILAALLIAGFVLFNRYLIHKGALNSGDIFTAILYAVILLVAHPILVIVFAKTQKRVLSVNQDGIETQIGSQAGKVRWAAVDSIVTTNELVIITGKNANVFSIPRRAFSDEQQRDEFIQLAQRFQVAAKVNKA